MANFFDQFDGAAADEITPTKRALLNSVAAGESPDYNTVYGGGRFEEMNDHPRRAVPIRSGPNAGRTSSAAGRYQFLGSTWDEAKNALGLPDFSPDSQDRAAAWLAERDYKKRTGRDLWADVEEAKADPRKLNFIGGALSKTWTSLPGGIEPNGATGGFARRMTDEFSSQSRQPQQASGAPMLIAPTQGAPTQSVTAANFFDQFDEGAPQASEQPTFDQRFQSMQTPENAQPLQAGLDRQATQMTTGPEQPKTAQQAVEQRNLLSGAQQGTTPNADQYKGKLVSTETFESDSGDVMYRDPSTGEVRPTDKSKQVAIRDPKDGVIKVYDRSEATNESGVVGAARVLAPGLAAGSPVTATAKVASAAVAPKVEMKASDTFAASKPYYREFTKEASKIEVPAQTAADFAERIRGSLSKAHFIPELADPVYKAVAILDKGEPLTLDALQSVKRVVGRSFNSNDKNVRDAAGVVSKELGKIVGEISPSAAKNLKAADEIHSTALAMQDLQRKSAVSDLRAGRAGYGGNAVNSMRQVLSPIVQRSLEGKSTLYKPNEIAAIREIVEGDQTTNALRLAGGYSPTKGPVNSSLGFFAGGPAIPAIGAVSNKLATIMTGKQIDRLKELVAKRSPAYAEAVAKSAEKYAKAHEDLAVEFSPNKFAAFMSASRALSSGLQRDGIQITAADLIRQLKQLEGPSKAAADSEQQPIPGAPSQ